MMSSLVRVHGPIARAKKKSRMGARMNRAAKGSAVTPAILSLLLVLLVVITAYVFASGDFKAPPPITEIGKQVDHQYALTLVVTSIVFVLSQLGLAWVIFRYRDRGQKAQYNHGNTKFEAIWTTATIVLFVGLGLMAHHAWAVTHLQPAGADALQIEVTANQFVFNFRYAGPDGKFGRLDPKQVSASSGNPVGLDSADPNAKDDIVVPTLTIPVNREIELLIRSQDVIHNFYVRELRLQQDAVPGMVIPIHFTATQVGRYDILCTQLCGLGHYKMHSFLDVVSEQDYQAFLKQQASQ
jgi:cytochrome c oxidase subunit II